MGDKRRQTGDMRQETLEGRQKHGDSGLEAGQETGDWRRDTREGSQETGQETGNRRHER